MLKKSFSLIELIFTIVIVSILLTVAVPKYFNSLEKTNLIKLKSDIALIRDGILRAKNTSLFQAQNQSLTTLDDNDIQLFNNILTNPINALENSSGNWSKESSNKYKAWLTTDKFVLFTYNNQTQTFDCSTDDENCLELTQ